MKIGDYQDLGLDGEAKILAAARELAGYGVYGEAIGPRALICSADAVSAVPGYNMFKENRRMVSPVVFIKEREEIGNEYYL